MALRASVSTAQVRMIPAGCGNVYVVANAAFQKLQCFIAFIASKLVFVGVCKGMLLINKTHSGSTIIVDFFPSLAPRGQF